MKSVVYTICFFILAIVNISNIAYAQCPEAQPSVYGYNAVGDSATVSWTAVSSIGYEYSIQPASSSAPTSGIAITASMIRIGNLQPGTAYKVWLRTNCGGGVYTPWVFISFSTPCGTPATVGVSGIWGDSATISWTAVGPSAKYEYVADTVATPPATNGTLVNATTVTVKGLIGAKTYYVFVRTQCGTSTYSSWSPVTTFFSAFPTQVSTVNTNGKAFVYPNPVVNKLNISGLQGVNTISLFNYQGSLILQKQATGNSFIDMTGYASGMYILQYKGEAGVGMLKIEKL